MQRLILIITFLFLMLVNSLIADEINEVTEEWEPYNFVKNNKITGMSTEIVEAVLKKANLKYSIIVYPWARAYRTALHNENVCIYTIARNSERENIFRWIGPIVPADPMYIWKLKNRKDIVVNSIEDAKKYKIGTKRDDANYILLKLRGFPLKNLDAVSSDEANINKLAKERIDLLISNKYTLQTLTKNNKHFISYNHMESTVVWPETEDETCKSEGYYMAFSKKTAPTVVDAAKNAFEELKREGKIKLIIDNYLSHNN